MSTIGLQKRIGIVGTGFVAKGLLVCLEDQPDLVVSKVLTRTDINTRSDFSRPELLTNVVAELIENSDLVVECSGDPVVGTDVVAEAMAAGLPVVTMNAELQVTTGSYFAGRGLITEAEGDQPGCLAALKEDVIGMGFTPLVYGNLKGFLNETPTPQEMQFWAQKNGFTLSLVTAATDGTKVQYEQALVANGLGADIVKPGLLGLVAPELTDGANQLAEAAVALGRPISDYLLSAPPPARKLSPGVFITAEHDPRLRDALAVYRMGEGPYYTLERPYHLPFLEIPKTIRRVLDQGTILLNNSEQPIVSIAAVAKQQIAPGTPIAQAIGSFTLRGICVRIVDEPEHVPMGLIKDARIRNSIEPGQQLTFGDVELPDSRALAIWRELLRNCIEDSSSTID